MDWDAVVEMARDFTMTNVKLVMDEREFNAHWPKEGSREGRGLPEPALRQVALAMRGAMV